MNSLEKNLLDLRHSLSSTKASLLFSIGVGCSIALFFRLLQVIDNKLIIFLVSYFWLVILVSISLKHFFQCTKIQKRIEEAIKNKN